MSGSRRIALWALAFAFACAPAAEAASKYRITSSSRPLISDNVSPVFALPGIHPIGARIQGRHMYVTSVEGVTILDISDPRRPVPVGALPLPHFENEDVDVGNGLLVITNDAEFSGAGIVHVVDVRNPRQPKLLASFDNNGGASGELMSAVLLGFTRDMVRLFTGQDLPIPQAVMDEFKAGIGHTASCIHDCDYLYLAGTGAGIEVLDLRKVRETGEIRLVKFWRPEITGFATHDVQVDSKGLAWIVGGEGTAAYDVTDPENPTLVTRTNPAYKNTGAVVGGGIPPSLMPTEDGVITDPVFGFTVGGRGDKEIDFIHHDSLRFPKRNEKAAPAGATYPRGGSGSVVGIVEEDYTRPTCEGAGSFQTWSIGETQLEPLDMWATEVQALPQGSGFAPAAGVCSAHYFDQRNGMTANAWYEEGVRFLDVSDPANIRQVGYWIPAKGETWSAIFHPFEDDPDSDVVFALDLVRGIEVLEVKRSGATARKARRAPIRRSWVRRRSATTSLQLTAKTGFSGKSRYGYVCRRLTARVARWR